MKHITVTITSICTVLLLSGCLGVPEGVTPVRPFDKTRYLGQWFEIARLDHRFERGLTKVNALYTERKDGGIDVLNRGYDREEARWSSATGRAYFVKSENEGYLKVSFFGPFYSSYIVFFIDDDHQYAFVTSYSKDYLWLLARKPVVPEDILEQFKSMVKAKGYDLQHLIVDNTSD